MPVSLDRLIAEVEPNVITEGMTRECIQIVGGDPDNVDDKKRTIALRDVECLAYSFRSLARIDNLNGLDGLTKLQLDNNQITKIDHIGHLVRAGRRRETGRAERESGSRGVCTYACESLGVQVCPCVTAKHNLSRW